MRLPIFLTLCLAASPAVADSARTVLVLDASGSMWGQIDGEAKIVIARRAIGDLLDTVPPETQIGLTAYGHRRKGDCADIETLVPVGAQSRPAIRAAIEGIRPKGKTPLSDAVATAAEALKYTEEKATVILVSDGRETCNADPCAVGRRLEETGVDFTAHVIGFDIEEGQDADQLRCLAENTGGDFVLASDATELREALERVTAPEPVVFDIDFSASANGGPVTDDLVWAIAPEEGDPVLDYESVAAPTLTLDTGTYTVEVLRTTDEAFATATVTVGPGEPTRHVLALEIPVPEASLNAPGTVAAGERFEVTWTGPDQLYDSIRIVAAGETDIAESALTSQGNPAILTAPATLGSYEIHYHWRDGTTDIATAALTVTEAQVTVSAPDTVAAGAPIAVEWTGPNAPYDTIQIVGEDGNAPVDTAQTSQGSPAAITAPTTPGPYEIRYFSRDGRAALAATTITVTSADITMTPPETVAAGKPFALEWTGPNAPYDAIQIVPSGGGRDIDSALARSGSPANLDAPDAPGTYELHYFSRDNDAVLATVPLTVSTAVAEPEPEPEAEPPAAEPAADAGVAEANGITLALPDGPLVAGTTVDVRWAGPGDKDDGIAIAPAGSADDVELTFELLSGGNPVPVAMPSEPGAYELRYIDGKWAVRARLPFTLKAAPE